MNFQHLYERARIAHMGSYFNPSEHARICIDFHSDKLEQLFNLVDQSYPPGPGADEEKVKLKAGYEKHLTAWLNALGRCMSSAITGGGNFPAKAQEKAHEKERKREKELREWVGAAFTRVRTYKDRLDKAGKTELDTAREQLAKRKAAQERMKLANRIVRGKGGDTDKINALAELGINAALAKELLTPDELGERGYAAFQIKNNAANIKRLEQRVQELENKEAAATADKAAGAFTEYTFQDGVVVFNTLEDRVQVLFEGRPDDDVRSALKSNGYKWSPNAGAWQRKLTEAAKYNVQQLFKPI